ncbi:hypothetical protein [Egbenema bharatensis]|uniref:hypothetical protein n=1 Tax=Egbenema bharatensis TaxID=3463334 RepID=UPI003A89CD88
MAEEFLPDFIPPARSSQAQREPIRHVLYGSKSTIARTISILHIKGYVCRNLRVEQAITD